MKTGFPNPEVHGPAPLSESRLHEPLDARAGVVVEGATGLLRTADRTLARLTCISIPPGFPRQNASQGWPKSREKAKILKNMTTTADPIQADPKKVEAFLATEYHIRKVELMQTLVVRNQVKVMDRIDEEERKEAPNLERIEHLRSEIDYLEGLRQAWAEDKIDQTLDILKEYEPREHTAGAR
jgi:hypothetical protein